MSSLPTHRDNAGPDTGGWRLLQAINRVEDSVARMSSDMSTRFDKLDERFISRREADARFEGSGRDLAELRADLAVSVTRAEAGLTGAFTRIDAAEARRLTDRRWAIGVLFTVLSLLLTLAGLVLTYLPR